MQLLEPAIDESDSQSDTNPRDCHTVSQPIKTAGTTAVLAARVPNCLLAAHAVNIDIHMVYLVC